MMKEKNIRELARRMNLVTIDNMCRYSIPQLVVMVANKVNELIGEVGQFESDVVESVKTQNENIQYLLGEGLLLEVESIFDEWVKDGTFDSLINQTALKKVNDLQNQINNLVLNANESKEITYTNLFYNESYPSKSVTNDYPYIAFGSPKSFESGKYLVYFRFNVAGTFNTQFKVGMVSDSGNITGSVTRESIPILSDSANDVVAYSIVELPENRDIRPSLNLKHLDTSFTPNMEINILNLFVCKLNEIDEKIVSELVDKGNVENIVVRYSASDNEIVQARGNHKVLNGRITEIEDNVKEVIADFNDFVQIKETTYTNLFYNESYPSKSVTNDYPYIAFGSPKSFESGKYLVYFDVNFNVTTLSSKIGVGFTSEDGLNLGKADENTPHVNQSKSNVITYDIVELSTTQSIRPILWLVHDKPIQIPDCTITVNQIFVCKLNEIDNVLLEKLSHTTSNIESLTYKSTGIDVNDFATKDYVNEVVGGIDMNGFATKTEVDCWGDSLTYGVGATNRLIESYPSRLQTFLGEGWKVNNYGVGGENTAMIAGRQGGMALIVNNFTIPSTTTPVKIDVYSDKGIKLQLRDLRIPPENGVNPCYISGVKGSLTVNETLTETYFTREEVGQEVAINRPQQIITYGSLQKGNVLIVYMGQNQGGHDDNEDIVRQYRKMLDNAQTNRYLFLGLHTKDKDNGEPLEKMMFNEFGRHFINLRQYMSAHDLADDGETVTSIWCLDDVGVVATDEDKRFVKMGYCPRSILTDGVHLTSQGYEIIFNLIKQRGQELGYW